MPDVVMGSVVATGPVLLPSELVLVPELAGPSKSGLVSLQEAGPSSRMPAASHAVRVGPSDRRMLAPV
jgi:hypothetical protein